MRGFLLTLARAKNEDMIVTVLTPERIGRYYRFYGARHSILQLGYFVDFEVEGDNGRFLPRMRSLRHLGFPWLYARDRLMVWQDLIQRLAVHLRDTEEIERFYFDLLLAAARHWERQNPRRIVLESYHALLRHEGRLHPIDRCFICEEAIGAHVSLMAAWHPAHPECLYTAPLDRTMIERFFATGKTIHMDDATVDTLYAVTQKGF